MLNHISIKNFAVIENTEVDFEDGLNIITGETGAGKSIAIEAISLALGDRADTSLIRTGKDKAQVELLCEYNGEEVVIQRELSQTGKNLCKLNGEIVTLARLNELSSKLADIHGQYDNQSLLNPDNHINLLDTFCREEVDKPKAEVSECYHRFTEAKSKLIKLLNVERENARKKDFYKFEIDEIKKANPIPGEDEELVNKVSLLQNSEKIYEALESSYQAMDGEESLLDRMAAVTKSLEGISSFSKELEALSQDAGDVYYRFKDIADDIRSIKEKLTFSPLELDEAILRLNLLDNLKKKYGATIEEVIAYKEKIEEELSIIENFDEEKLRLEKILLDTKKELDQKCLVLTEARKKIALDLAGRIQFELQDLNFKDAKLSIEVNQLKNATENGRDEVRILISTNRGEDLKPLEKVVSGGEMSRIMLAFKNIVSSYDGIPTLIFDEIDNGISGITASIVAKKLKEIAKNHQIICITHLPQIAASGDFNYRIYKEVDDEKTYTSIDRLNEDEKVSEIARLLGGTNITETTLQSAKELIESSR